MAPHTAALERDFQRFQRELPRDFPDHVRLTYRIDLTGRYLGERVPHPIGKGSGQLSLNAGQLEDDAAAGLAFVVLKTVIAQDETGAQSMAAWAIHETKMQVERRRSATGRTGWTVTWKGRGWDRSLEEYLALVRAGRDLTRAEALEAVKSLTSFEAQRMHFLDGGFLPARQAVFDDPEIQKKYPYAKAAQASFENLKPRPVTPFYPEMSSQAIQPAFGQAMARQITPDQAIKQMADKMRQIIKKG